MENIKTYKQSDQELDLVVDRTLLETWLVNTSEGSNLLPDERERFINTALAFQLNPWKREIHVKLDSSKQSRHIVFIVGYEVYVKKAERTRLLDGWRAWIEGSGETLKGVIEIYRKDWHHPFIHEVYWNEVVQTNEQGEVLSFWQKMPRFQLRKVAISQGFRLAFSNEIGGIPYDGSELPIQEAFSGATQAANKTINQNSKVSLNPNQSAKKPEVSLEETIRNRTNANLQYLKPAHVSWIMAQLLIEKSEKQLKGLLFHVERAISEGKGEVPKIVRSNSRVQHFPNQKPFNSSSNNDRQNLPHAVGAEDQIF